jgi:putative CocE/NonD family hydrolase
MRANVRVPGHDGTVLVADAYPAEGGGPAPVVVTRTPYDRSIHRAEGAGWARHGFGYVVQDIRGRYGSDGTWEPYRNERGDGAALIDWVLAQPWCDGRVIALGGSYGAYTAWTMAIERPAAVRAVVSLGPAMGLAQVKFDRSGILRLAEHATWWAERAEGRTSRTGISAAMFAAEPDLLRHLPVADLPARMWPELAHWTDVIEQRPDRVAPEAVTEAELAALPAAVLHIGGWYDLLVDETLHQWRIAGSAVSQRPPRSLLIGPWEHDLGYAATTTVGCRDHGPGSRVAMGQRQVGWLRAVLAGRGRADAQVFLVGGGWWRGDRWPPATTTQVWHAHGDGTLRERPGEAGTGFRYDPGDPYPSADPCADRAPLISRRTDAVRFITAPLPGQLVVAGTLMVRLAATSSARSTDFVVRLCEITAEGAVIALTQGAVDTGRAGPGPYDIVLDPAAVRVPAGSRLLLEVTSSDFPHLARCIGTNRYRDTVAQPAEQTVSRAELHLSIMEDG